MHSRMRLAERLKPAPRISASEIDADCGPRAFDPTVQPTTVSWEWFNRGPGQNGEGWVRSHVAKLAALLQTCGSGAASSKSPSKYKTCTFLDPAFLSACTVPTTMLQSHPIRRGTCPGCFRFGRICSPTQSHTIRGAGQLRIGGMLWCGRKLGIGMSPQSATQIPAARI